MLSLRQEWHPRGLPYIYADPKLRYGANLLPVDYAPPSLTSPLFSYPYARTREALQRLRRAGAHNVERRHLENERDAWVKRHAGAFDRVLIDAPCSGLGSLRRRPEARWRKQPGDIPALSSLQRELLDHAAGLVRAGGVIGYSTCSPHLAETPTR